DHLAVAHFKLAQMLALLPGELPENFPAARVARELRRPCVELEAATLGRDGDTQRIAGKNRIGRRRQRHWFAPAATRLAESVNLHDTLRRFEPAALGDLRDRRFDIRAQKLEQLAARLAD